MSEQPAWKMGHLAAASIGTYADKIILPAQPETLQCIALGPKRELYSSVGKPQTKGSDVEDSYYTLHLPGRPNPTMKIVGGGHGTMFSVHPDGDLLIHWAGRGIIKMPFTPGSVQMTTRTPWGLPFTRGVSGVSGDPDHGQVLLYGGGRATVWPLEVVEAGVGAPAYPGWTLPAGDNYLRQGVTCYGPEVLYLVGWPRHDQRIHVFNVKTGQEYVRHARLVAPNSPAFHQEPEGIIVDQGRPMIGFTTLAAGGGYSHMIQTLSAFNGRLGSDVGMVEVVSDVLNGRRPNGTVKQQRKKGDQLWIRSTWHGTLAGITLDWYVTGFNTFYAAKFCRKV